MAFGFCRYEHLFLQKTLPFSLHHVLHSYDIPQQPESSNSPVACLRQADIWHPWGTALCHESMGSGQINSRSLVIRLLVLCDFLERIPHSLLRYLLLLLHYTILSCICWLPWIWICLGRLLDRNRSINHVFLVDSITSIVMWGRSILLTICMSNRLPSSCSITRT